MYIAVDAAGIGKHRALNHEPFLVPADAGIVKESVIRRYGRNAPLPPSLRGVRCFAYADEQVIHGTGVVELEDARNESLSIRIVVHFWVGEAQEGGEAG